MSIYTQNMQMSHNLSQPAPSKGSELIQQFEEEDRIQDEMFFDINDGVSYTPYNAEPIYPNPYIELEPCCDFDQARKKNCPNFCGASSICLDEVYNVKDDAKTAHALRDCKAIWI